MPENESPNRFSKVGKIQKICMSNWCADEKVNVMLRADWKILDSYTLVSEDYPYHCSTNLFYILGHEDPNAQVPLTEREIDEQRRREEEKKKSEQRWREWEKEHQVQNSPSTNNGD